MTYEEFCEQYQQAFDNMNKYSKKFETIGSQMYLNEMIDLAEAHPDFLERFENELEAQEYDS